MILRNCKGNNLNTFKKYLAALILLTVIESFLFDVHGQDVYNLSAPALGVTAGSVVLIWEAHYRPDYSNFDTIRKRRYTIYQDRRPIAVTYDKTFIVTGLEASTRYSFSVKQQSGDNVPDSAITLEVTTKKKGKISNVRSFGASGNGTKLDTKPVQDAINHCEKNGIVLIPAGNYLVDHLELKSDITLEIVRGAVLIFAGPGDGSNYPEQKGELPAVDSAIEYSSCNLISGIDVHNVSITGEGTIDGNGDLWWPYTGKLRRPVLLEFVLSSNILVQQVTMQDPPFYNNHLLYVDNALYAGVKFYKASAADGTNGDALDPDGARNVLIVGCIFGNQDDSISIKGHGRYRIGENITVRDCLFNGNAAPGSAPLGFALGSGCRVRHVVVRDCIFRNAASLANIKTNRQRPFTFAEDVLIENIIFYNTLHVDRMWNRAPISVDQFYYAAEGEDPAVTAPLQAETPFFKNIHFKNIMIDNPVGNGIYLCGLPEFPLSDIHFSDIYVRSLNGITAQNVDGLYMGGMRFLPVGKKITAFK